MDHQPRDDRKRKAVWVGKGKESRDEGRRAGCTSGIDKDVRDINHQRNEEVASHIALWMSSTHSLEGKQFVLLDWFSNPHLPRWDGWSTGYTSEISPASEGLQSLFCVITHNHSHTAPITEVNRCYGNVCYRTFKNGLQFMKESAIFISKNIWTYNSVLDISTPSKMHKYRFRLSLANMLPHTLTLSCPKM